MPGLREQLGVILVPQLTLVIGSGCGLGLALGRVLVTHTQQLLGYGTSDGRGLGEGVLCARQATRAWGAGAMVGTGVRRREVRAEAGLRRHGRYL